jgi:4-hydroxy-4-methyl-2-oxoglutarate aldolase
MNLIDQIIDFCKKNRISTTEVADALGKCGVFPKVLPISTNMYRVGPVRCVFTANNSNWDVHEQIRHVKDGEVVIIFTHGCDDGRAIIGDLISKYVLLYRGATAIVVQGPVRDAAALRREGFAIWSDGVSPLGCFNKPVDAYPATMEAEVRARYDGSLAVCDDGGVTIIPRESLDAVMLERLHKIQMQEEIWFFCLDILKWDTMKIVCEKAYLKETDLLSSVHLEKLKDLIKPLDSN